MNMQDLRKQLHEAFKERLSQILIQYSLDLFDNIHEFTESPSEFCQKWVESNCQPMGEFSREEAIKEIDAWQEKEEDEKI